MKRLKRIVIPCITIVTLIALYLASGAGASAAILPQRLRNTTCGAWGVVASPNVGTTNNVLSGIAAISVNNVWAVGSYSNGNGGFTLVEHWNGTQWKVVASPNVNGNGSLSGVAAIAANNIWAVGSYINASNIGQTLIEHWNGSAWSIVSSPNVGSQGDGLGAIAAVSSTDIWAVGSFSGNTGYQSLFEHWNGSSWSIKSGPNAGPIASVAALASNDIWAVGSTTNNGIQTLVEHWNGSTWSIVPSSGPATAINTLNAVAAISTNNVWAAGDDTNSTAPSAEYAPLIEHWNGSSWSIVTSAVVGTSDLVNGIAALSASNIWVVGDYRTGIDPSGPYFTLIEHWNGTKWSVVKSPSPGSIASDLAAAARVPATNKVWAVGFTIDNNNISHTLAESHC